MGLEKRWDDLSAMAGNFEFDLESCYNWSLPNEHGGAPMLNGHDVKDLGDRNDNAFDLEKEVEMLEGQVQDRQDPKQDERRSYSAATDYGGGPAARSTPTPSTGQPDPVRSEFDMPRVLTKRRPNDLVDPIPHASRLRYEYAGYGSRRRKDAHSREHMPPITEGEWSVRSDHNAYTVSLKANGHIDVPRSGYEARSRDDEDHNGWSEELDGMFGWSAVSFRR